MNRASWRWVAILLAVLANVGYFADLAAPTRQLTILPFLLMGPGIALIRLARIRGVIPALVLAVALSLALDTLVAEAMLYTAWSPGAALVVLSIATLLGAAWPARKQMVSTPPVPQLADAVYAPAMTGAGAPITVAQAPIDREQPSSQAERSLVALDRLAASIGALREEAAERLRTNPAANSQTGKEI